MQRQIYANLFNSHNILTIFVLFFFFVHSFVFVYFDIGCGAYVCTLNMLISRYFCCPLQFRHIRIWCDYGCCRFNVVSSSIKKCRVKIKCAQRLNILVLKGFFSPLLSRYCCFSILCFFISLFLLQALIMFHIFCSERWFSFGQIFFFCAIGYVFGSSTNLDQLPSHRHFKRCSRMIFTCVGFFFSLFVTYVLATEFVFFFSFLCLVWLISIANRHTLTSVHSQIIVQKHCLTLMLLPWCLLWIPLKKIPFRKNHELKIPLKFENLI